MRDAAVAYVTNLLKPTEAPTQTVTEVPEFYDSEDVSGPQSGAASRSPPITRHDNPQTRGAGVQMEFELTPGQWVPAVYHTSIRSQLQPATARTFEWKPNSTDVEDVTSHDCDGYYPRENTQGYQNSLVQSQHRYHCKQPQYAIDEMWFGGRIVLGSDKHPIMAFPHLPATICSKIHGAEIAMLEEVDLRLELRDILARMSKNNDANRKNRKTFMDRRNHHLKEAKMKRATQA
ncbi:MAG: hypothetical protein Q9226_005392 [Calogaya cf. arnoldii]